MTTATLHFQDTPTRDRFILVAHSLGLHGKVKSQPGAFRFRVVTECPDEKTKEALIAAWSRVTCDRK